MGAPPSGSDRLAKCAKCGLIIRLCLVCSFALKQLRDCNTNIKSSVSTIWSTESRLHDHNLIIISYHNMISISAEKVTWNSSRLYFISSYISLYNSSIISISFHSTNLKPVNFAGYYVSYVPVVVDMVGISKRHARKDGRTDKCCSTAQRRGDDRDVYYSLYSVRILYTWMVSVGVVVAIVCARSIAALRVLRPKCRNYQCILKQIFQWVILPNKRPVTTVYNCKCTHVNK